MQNYLQIVQPVSPKKITKRNGAVIVFDGEKITLAIYKAFKATGEDNMQEAERVSNIVIERLNPHVTPNVEEVQDLVEDVLIEEKKIKVAKSYILYRAKHKEVRDTKSTFVNVQNIINNYLYQDDWKVKENSNESYSFSGLLLYTAGQVMKNYNLTEVYTRDIAEAHSKGYVHIHDLSHGVIGYCAGWSLKNLILEGFGGVPNKVDCKPAKHLITLVHQMVNYIGCMQMEFAGAQAFSSVDTLLAPFVKVHKLNYKEVKQAIQQLIFSLNIPSRWGSQYPFSNLTFDWKVPDDMKDDAAVVGGKLQDFKYSDCQAEMDMINQAFLEVMLEGDAKGRVFSFPIPTYNLTRDFDWDSDNANLLFELTAKYGIPYFQNYIGSNLDPSSIRAMCCRLNINQTELLNRPGGMWAPGDSTGSVGVVTINMNRLGYECNTKDEFYNKLDYYMHLAKESLETKRKIVNKNLQQGLMPFTKRYLGTFRNHFSTIGLCGMHECCINFLGHGIETKEGTDFTIEVMHYMRDRLQEFQKETKNLYNLEATPAESTSYRFARLDKEMHPEIFTSGKDEPYLTNSTHLPVDFTDDVLEALEHQNKIQPLYTGGTMFHTFLGEMISSPDACKNMVRKIANNTSLPYFSITPTFSICPDHGYIKGEKDVCDTCSKKTEIYTRIVGYFRPVDRWNKGKCEEFKDRKTYCES